MTSKRHGYIRHWYSFVQFGTPWYHATYLTIKISGNLWPVMLARLAVRLTTFMIWKCKDCIIFFAWSSVTSKMATFIATNFLLPSLSLFRGQFRQTSSYSPVAPTSDGYRSTRRTRTTSSCLSRTLQTSSLWITTASAEKFTFQTWIRTWSCKSHISIC